MSLTMEGLNEIAKALQELTDEEAVSKAITKACLLVEKTAKQKAPKGNGELRRSITSEVNGTTGMVFTPLEYAPYVEFGTGLFAEEGGRMDVPWNYQDDEGNWHSTSGRKPSPFLRPALLENKDKILKIIKEGKA